MQIRCERCQAEYELDDSQVRGGSVRVHCRACGHVFAVAQPGSNQTAAGASATHAETADWFLQTPDGKVHRLHGLASVHTWIIEHRITRQDRISTDGHAWQRASELVELLPFFDVVDQANRAHADAEPARDRAGQAKPSRRTANSPTQRRSSPQAMAISVPNDEARASHLRPPVVDMQTAGAGSNLHAHGALKIFVGLTVAAGVAYTGIQWQRGRVHSTAIATRASGSIASSPSHPWVRPPEAKPDLKPDLGAGSAAVQEADAGTMAGLSTKGPVVEALPSPPHEQVESVPEKMAAVVRPESYEKLIANGDRALENGSDGKAKDFYQRALRMRSAGPDALSGLAFVALDRGQIPASYELFKRALAVKPSFGPALFGMAEIHRARGEKALALQSYRRYLQLWPKGSEAAAARRQVKLLQTGK
jgi:predicted Zn finger-like uncharacterized protein